MAKQNKWTRGAGKGPGYHPPATSRQIRRDPVLGGSPSTYGAVPAPGSPGDGQYLAQPQFVDEAPLDASPFAIAAESAAGAASALRGMTSSFRGLVDTIRSEPSESRAAYDLERAIEREIQLRVNLDLQGLANGRTPGLAAYTPHDAAERFMTYALAGGGSEGSGRINLGDGTMSFGGRRHPVRNAQIRNVDLALGGLDSADFSAETYLVTDSITGITERRMRRVPTGRDMPSDAHYSLMSFRHINHLVKDVIHASYLDQFCTAFLNAVTDAGRGPTTRFGLPGVLMIELRSGVTFKQVDDALKNYGRLLGDMRAKMEARVSIGPEPAKTRQVGNARAIKRTVFGTQTSDQVDSIRGRTTKPNA